MFEFFQMKYKNKTSTFSFWLIWSYGHFGYFVIFDRHYLIFIKSKPITQASLFAWSGYEIVIRDNYHWKFIIFNFCSRNTGLAENTQNISWKLGRWSDSLFSLIWFLFNFLEHSKELSKKTLRNLLELLKIEFQNQPFRPYSSSSIDYQKKKILFKCNLMRGVQIHSHFWVKNGFELSLSGGQVSKILTLDPRKGVKSSPVDPSKMTNHQLLSKNYSNF